ncbi:hypothetical protein [Actinopolymorpha alba]|uniref:hypothetical protein n=1 Tax=Actinopolymorpha alba TaxID=533267 RepID=UPI0003624190|nr:hypothetical protein [Actinopolymorpha alba]
MSNPGGGLLRVMRGAVLAVCCTTLALLGHLGGGGGMAPLPALLAVTLLLGAGFTILAQHRRSFGQIAVAAIAAQAIYHLAFSLSPGDHGQPATAFPPSGSAYLPAGLPVYVNLPMLAGHLVAALVMAGLLAHGESLLWALFHLLGLVRLPALARPVSLGLPGRVRAFRVDVPAISELLLGRVHRRRGPPLPAVG